MHKNIYLLILLSTLFVSCSDEFLDRPPIDQIEEDAFFRNESEMRAATVAIYTAIQSQDYFGEGWAIEEIPSDDSRRSAASGIDNFAANPNNENVAKYWRGHYRAITLANIVIEKAPDADLTDEVRREIVGEARFLRGLTYFNLVRIYGGVPIVTEIPRLERDLFPARSTVDEVYAFLIADLENAIESLPVSSDPSRATKGAAQAYLASVYLTRREFTKSRDLAREVINSGAYELVDSIPELWLYPMSDNNRESIFEIQFAGCEAFGTGNMRQAFYAPFNSGITKGADGWGVMVPTTPVVDQPGTTALDVWEEGDKRRYWTLMEPGNSYPTINPGEGYIFPANGAGGNVATIKKYVMGGGSNVCFMSTPQNGSLMRYSEVLWIYAESVAELQNGGTVDPFILDLINPLRLRAGLSPFQVIELDDIDAERRREFMFEGKRWFDILRKGEDAAVSLMRLSGRTLTKEKLLFPIPALEVEINTNLVQNPGY